MKIQYKSNAGIVIAGLLFSVNVNASSVSLVDDDRYIRINGQVSSYNGNQSWSRQEYAPAGPGSYSQTLYESKTINTNTATSSAAIDSDIQVFADGMTIAGSGSSYSHAITEKETNPRFRYTDANGRSEQEFMFTIEEDTYFMLSGNIEYDELVGNAYGGAAFSLRNSYWSGNSFNLSMGTSSSYEDFSNNFLFGGLLVAGTYTFEIYAYTDVDVYSYNSGEVESSASYTFDLALGGTSPFRSSVAAVPVPAAGWLFGSALIGLLGLRRSKVYQS